MAGSTKDSPSFPRALEGASRAETLAHKAIIWWLPILYFLISSLFYLRTYDSAQVKITIVQMGGLALLCLWVIRLVEAGGAAFTKDDLVCLSPFLAYLAIGIISFLHAPYMMASVDFFLRHCFFMIAALTLIYEFEAPALRRLTNWLIWAAWVAVGYGFLQWIDVKFFPPGIGKGIDPFIWRGAFGARILSTYGNPNFFADFLVIVFPVLFGEYLKTKKIGLTALMALLVFDLYATGTKGAWVAFAIELLISGLIAFSYFKEQVAPYKKWFFGAIAAGVLAFSAFFVKDLEARIVSVNFRLFTWEATWEMIMTQPWLGTGIGSFPPCYPAFRRPPIFHIEGKHNTETDHAEDEYLEELFDNGILGFGVFMWLVISTVVIGLRSLGRLSRSLLKNGRPPPEAYELAGYVVAFVGMLVHNFFDVSMRFVSSGVYLGLLSGVVINMSRGKALFELHSLRGEPQPQKPGKREEPAPPSAWKTASEFFIWPLRLASWFALFYVIFGSPNLFDTARFQGILSEFNALQGPVDRLVLGGEFLQWYLSWGVLLACVLGLGYVFARIVKASENPLVPAAVLIAAWPMYLFWGYFKGDIHHNIGIFLSKQRQWSAAIQHYRDVTRLDPYFPMARYFLGNVYTDRFDMEKSYHPEWGDSNDVPRDDYERALSAYNGVRKLAPNYVQMHYQTGVLHLKRAQWAMRESRPQEAAAFLNKALTRFRLYENLDPVFGPNFYRMAQVHLMLKDLPAAADDYERYVTAAKCAVSPGLIKRPFLKRTILAYQKYYDEPGFPYPVHRHKHAEAYANLGNVYFWMDRLRASETAYKQAMALEPGFDDLRGHLAALYKKAKGEGRLRGAIPAPSSAPANAIAPKG